MRNADFMNPEGLADYLGIPIRTVYAWRYRGEGGPPSYRIGRHVRYRRADVEAWIEQQGQDGRVASGA